MNELAERVSLGQRIQQAWLRALLILFAVLVIWSGSPAGQAQDGSSPPTQPLPVGQDLRFEHLTTEDGLSEGRVWGITQDSRGFMWFATWDGLNRYDGYEFKVYRQEPDNPNSPSGNSFWVIYEDRAGMIWVGSPTGGGLSRFDPTTEQWTRYQHAPGDPNSLGSNNVYAILEDSAGVLWIGTEGGGLNRFDGETGDGPARFTRFGHDPNDPHSLGSAFVSSIYEDRSGALWIGTYGGGLHRLDRETETFTRYQHDPNDPGRLSFDIVYPIYEDRFGVLWVGTYGGGLNVFDRGTGTFKHYQHDPQDPNSLGGNTVTGIREDRSGNLWIATFDGGLCRYHRETDSFTTHQHDEGDPRSLVSSSTSALFVDHAGILWIGTAGSGISKLDPSAQAFGLYRHNPTDSNSLSNNDIRAVYEDRFGDLWIGTWGGLDRLDPETGRFTHYLHDPADPDSLSDNHVFAIEEDSAGMLWVGVDTHGLNRLDRDSETFSHYRHDPTDPDSLSDDSVMSLYADRRGTLWVGTFAGGLDAFDPQSQNGQARFIHYRHDPEDPRSLGEGIVYTILEDQAGELWVGTGGGGLCRFDRDTETFACYKHDPQDASSLGSDAIWALYEDREGALWIGTSGGLNRLDSRTGKLLRYTTADGLPHNTVYGILEDNASSPDAHGYLWLSTARGLTRFDPEAGTFQNYGPSDGLPGGGYSFGANLKASTGELLFGSPNGLTRFDPEYVQDNPHIPPVHITGIQVADIPVTVGDDSPLRKPVLAAEELVLDHDDRIVSFEFAALSYNAPQENRYRYKLEGFEEEWHEVGSDRRSATYTNLDPGEYTFRVLGANNRGVWNEGGDSLKVTITPPWWGTWWFRGGMLLLLVGLVAGGFVWQRDSARRREHHLEATVDERTHELDERVKELDCLYGISRLAGQQGISLEEILQGTVQLIPPGFQYPEIACACITLDGREFNTPNCEESPWQLRADIVVWARRAGSVEVGYLEQRPEQDEGPFLTEEIRLLNAIAERLGRIAERKQAESALRESEEKYRDLVEKVYDVIYAVDTEGVMTYVSPAIESFLGFTSEQAIGQPFVRFIETEDLGRIEASWQKLMSGVSPGPAEYRALTSSGETRWMRVSSRPIVEEDRVTGVQGVLTDITERKRLDEQLEKAAMAAERQRLARDLHDSVTQTLFSASVIAEATPRIWQKNPESAERNLDMIVGMLHGALAEMRTLLLELRPDTIRGQTLGRLLQSLVEAHQPRLNAPISLSVEGDFVLPQDVTIALHRVAQEGLNNASKHAEASDVELKLVCSRSHVTLSIRDNGRGFDRQTIGAGSLGLVTMAERMESIGGTLSVYSKPDEGTEISAFWSEQGESSDE